MVYKGLEDSLEDSLEDTPRITLTERDSLGIGLLGAVLQAFIDNLGGANGAAKIVFIAWRTA